jgi:hypothetical protein
MTAHRCLSALPSLWLFLYCASSTLFIISLILSILTFSRYLQYPLKQSPHCRILHYSSILLLLVSTEITLKYAAVAVSILGPLPTVHLPFIGYDQSPKLHLIQGQIGTVGPFSALLASCAHSLRMAQQYSIRMSCDYIIIQKRLK